MFHVAPDSEVLRLRSWLDDSVIKYRASCCADSTKASYRTYRKVYFEFCAKIMCPPVSITTANLGRYAAYLADVKQLLLCSILKYLNIVRLLHLKGGLSNPLIDCWILDSVIRGIKRCNGKQPDRKLPITPHILLRMHRLINKDSSFDVVFWAICLVFFLVWSGNRM